jgi:cellulose biosynthesis protein BcsQ
MDGDAVKAARERSGRTQEEFAAWLNSLSGRKYDRSRVSRWENGAERIPADVVGMIQLGQLKFEATGRCCTVSVANMKGGVGKTETSINQAFVLARSGARTLLVDADSQGNASRHVGISRGEGRRLEDEGRTLYHALTRRAAVTEVIKQTGVENLDVIPSSIPLALAESELGSEPDRNRMRDTLAGIAERYDYIIIDCSPSLGVVTVNALSASDYVLVPVQTEPYAIDGFVHLRSTIDNVRERANDELRILGIVPTMYNARQSQDRASLDDIRRDAKRHGVPVFEAIPRATICAQAAAANRITLDADPGTPGLFSYIEIAVSLGGIKYGA